jgi:hypothetical protein
MKHFHVHATMAGCTYRLDIIPPPAKRADRSALRSIDDYALRTVNSVVSLRTRRSLHPVLGAKVFLSRYFEWSLREESVSMSVVWLLLSVSSELSGMARWQSFIHPRNRTPVGKQPSDGVVSFSESAGAITSTNACELSSPRADLD